MALSYPDIDFILRHNDKELINNLSIYLIYLKLNEKTANYRELINEIKQD